ncbi:lipoprotein [Streptomyces sp. x-80]|uniref:LptM family lipoprotein n=1 Tax=Streptomyces sp. x-80 TaxID=2789282 RepID=UPI00397EB283
MRKIISGTALVLTAALLTGCGSDDGPPKADKSANASMKPKPGSGNSEVKHEVTLEVLGHGTSQVYYNLNTNKMEKVQLPWKKTSTVTLTTDAEKRIGTTVSVVPGSVYNADGTMRAAACVITVDGKKVADNEGGKSNKMCEYNLK